VIDSMSRHGRLCLLLGVVALVAMGNTLVLAQDDPWASLRSARENLAANSPLTADFAQSFTPAGFSTGERETGRLYLALPDCLRWDYVEPYPRIYLLCGDTVWAWSPGEPVGDRFDRISRDESGLDFLLLSVDRLIERYAVTGSDEANGSTRLDLDPLTDEAAFQEATIRLDASTGYPLEISYSDTEGNRTHFELSSFAPSAARDPFTPPDHIEWVVNE
jgi:outer membrane lipoprotein-sorting protein